jgi:acyl dehydratase
MKFADLHAAQVLESGDCAVSEADIIEYARQFDPQPFHIDRETAAQTRWGGVIASGFHTCSLAMRLMVDHVLKDSESIGSPGLEYVKWPHPVRPGDRLRVRAQVLEKTISKSGRIGVLRWQWTCLNQEDTPVLELVATSFFAIGNVRTEG